MAENNKIINSTISKEDRNCWILNILIHHVAPTAVRKLFNDKIPPNDLASILLSNVKTIQDLVKRNIIKKHERDILVRIPGFKLPSRKSSPNKTGVFTNNNYMYKLCKQGEYLQWRNRSMYSGS